MMKQRILIYGLIAALLCSGSSALYYKVRATDYESRWADSMKKLAGQIRTPYPSKTNELPATVYLQSTNNTASLEAELRALLLELEQKDQEIADLKARDARARKLPSAEERQARMEELKQTDPEAYEEMMARMEDMRTRRQTAFAERASTLLDRTPSGLTEEQLVEREIMLETLNDIWSLSEELASGEGNRLEAMQEIWRKSREIQPLLQDERARQLYDLGVASGYSDEEAEVFVDYINETLQATTLPTSGRNAGRRRSQEGR